MTESDKKAWEQFLKSNSLTLIGKIILTTKAARWYRDGTFFSPSLRWWHPVSWLYLVLMAVAATPVCMFTDLTLKDVFEEVVKTFTVSKYFKDNPDKLRWVDS